MAQILTCLKLSGCKLGLLANFNVRHLKDGIKRVILLSLGWLCDILCVSFVLKKAYFNP
ncbi:MAG: hypothetical protein KAV44_08615 [Bacteroidales bacterium]|nr:hypothetical protein [Bacteroidales bacterium]